MGLAWQHGPLAAASVGRFLTPRLLPEPGRYPVAYFPQLEVGNAAWRHDSLPSRAAVLAAVSSECCDPTKTSMPQGFQNEKYPDNHPWNERKAKHDERILT
jgi:hypothetical protein